MSIRDQRVGTSHSDRVKEDVSLEYFSLSQRIHIPLRISENLWGTWRSVWVGWVGGSFLSEYLWGVGHGVVYTSEIFWGY